MIHLNWIERLEEFLEVFVGQGDGDVEFVVFISHLNV